MAGIIRNLKNPFTGNYIFPVTKTKAVYNDDGTRLDNYLGAMYGSPSNNILINANFAKVVNQRGVSFPFSTPNAYFIDRWSTNEYVSSIGKTTSGLLITSNSLGSGGIKQIIEDNLVGKYVTLSARINHTENVQLTWKVVANGSSEKGYKDIGMLKISHSSENVVVTVSALPGKYMEVDWVKLEYGEVATPYAPRLYAEELWLCQRYYQIRSSNNISSVDLRPKMRDIPPTITQKGSSYSYDTEL